MLLFFLLQLAGFLYTRNSDQQLNLVIQKTGLIFIPLALNSGFINKQTRLNLLKIFSVVITLACVYCLVVAAWNWNKDHQSHVFFYFSLIRPISQHAVQFSILLLIALVHLFESLRISRVVFNKYFDIFMLILFSVFLFLLSSKLIIILYLLYLIYFCLDFLRKKKGKRVIVVILVAICFLTGTIVLLTRNKVSDRFRDIVDGDMQLIRQEKFNPGIYFNGLQFRLLEWRFVAEILTEENAWLQGVSAGDKQRLLDQKYISAEMYTGDPARGDKGFLGYNAHNQFLESLLQSGIVGFLSFLIICISLVKMMLQKKNRELRLVTITVLLYSFTESVFETQYGMVIFIFFPLFFYIDNEKYVQPDRNENLNPLQEKTK